MNLWVCPDDRNPLANNGAALVCSRCGHEFHCVDGVPVFGDDAGNRGASASYPDELWQAMQQQPTEEAAESFCRRHRLTRTSKSADWPGTISVLDGGRLLEVGAGFGDDTLELGRRNTEVVSLVPTVANSRIVNRRLEQQSAARAALAVVRDLDRLPLEDRSIDTIAMEEAAARGFGLGDLGAVAAEWRRVLRPTGRLVLGLENGLHRAPGVRQLLAKPLKSAPAEPLNRCIRRGSPAPGGPALGIRRSLGRLRHGFTRPSIMAPLPDPNGVEIVVPIHDPVVLGYCFSSLLRRNSVRARAAASAARLAGRLNLLRFLVPYYYLVFDRDPDSDPGRRR